MSVLAALSFLLLLPQADKFDDARIRQLIQQLGADFLEEREPARQALEKAGKAAEGQLVDALASPDYRIRRACLELLTPLKTPAALRRANDLFALDEDPTVREAAFRLFQALGKDAEDALIAALESANLEFRRGALQTLTEFKSQKCAGRVSELYDRESDKGLKEAAFKCLTSLGPPAEPFLIKYLGDPDAGVRREALQGLRSTPSESAVAAVARLFGQEMDPSVLDPAAEFLKRAGPKAESAFIQGLKGASPATRLKSLEGLKELKSAKALDAVAELYLGENPPDLREKAAEYLKSQGTRAEDVLMLGLSSKDSSLLLLSLQTLGEIGSEKPLEAVGRMFREDGRKDVHEKCFEYLSRLGLKAEKDLLDALSDENKEIRKKAVLALGEAKSERAIPRLIDFMTELDPGMKEASEIALAAIGPKAIAEVAKAVTANRLRKTVAEAIETNYLRTEIERLLDDQIGQDDFSGYCEGQFEGLKTLGATKVAPILIRIMSEQKPIFRGVRRRDQSDRFKASMRELAVLALGDLGAEGSLPALRAFTKELASMNATKDLREATLKSLYRLGDPKPLEDRLREARANADQMLKAEGEDQLEEACDEIFHLGLLYDFLKRYDESSRAYLDLLRILEQPKMEKVRGSFVQTAYYNLACGSSKTGDRAKSIEWLEKAIRAGYKDRDWIRKDKDLDGIRNEEGYKKLLSNDALFEPGPPDPPPAPRKPGD